MYHFSGFWTSPYKGKVETIEFDHNPCWTGLGVKTDIHGNKWDVNAIMGGYLCARPNGYYAYSTVTNDYPRELIRSWIPYKYRIVKNGLGFTGP